VRRRLPWLLAWLTLAPGVAAAADCADWVATAVSIQGLAEVRRAQDARWVRTGLGDRYCPGDTLRIGPRSRAAVVLRNEAVLRLDQQTTITFVAAPAERGTVIDLVLGAVNFLSRLRRGLQVNTSFVNALVEGTEFWIRVEPDGALLAVVEGRVVAENPGGRLVLTGGQSAIARAGEAPRPFIVVRPGEAVEWALHYPAVADIRPDEFTDPALRAAAAAFRRGDLADALAGLDAVPVDLPDPRVQAFRAALLLAVGRAEEARAALDRALAANPRDARALALQSVVALVTGDTAEAERRARAAVAADPASAAGQIALSYVRQARAALRGALALAQEAVRVDPDNALAWARLAELRLAFGRLRDAREAADRAAALNPNLGRTQTVLGFARLADLDAKGAREAFERAIRLDQSDPLPRLGLGLAIIRRGDLAEGRHQLEVAAGLDPGNALVRSYLGKAYYEERRADRAEEQFELAKRLDPNDPTPWFYDAILEQSENRPVEALRDLEHAIRLNDNRAVFRSRLLLDEDLAARSASLARIYEDLGFGQLALSEAFRSVAVDPTNHSAHRFLADAYAALPRHEIARVSEVLQTQLLQPLGVNPVPPRLAAAELFIHERAGPTEPGLNEFDALFERNRLSVRASGVAGGNGTRGDEVAVGGLWNRVSASIGQFHYETDGFRPNNDLEEDLYNAFVQARLLRTTSAQVELRAQDSERGDLLLAFDPENFLPDLRLNDEIRSARAGLRHGLAPGSDLLLSAIYQDGTFDTRVGPPVRVLIEEEGLLTEGQYLLRTRPLGLIVGAGFFDATVTEDLTFPFLSSRDDDAVSQVNGYVYSNIALLDALTATVGASADLFHGGVRDRDQVNPKLGATWAPLPGTTVRATAFRTLTRSLPSNQTIEPTQVAGFNQFFNDTEATEAWRYGVGIDQRLSRSAYVGAEASRRDLEVPFTDVSTGMEVVRIADWREVFGRGYLYWAPSRWLALGAEYEYERFDRDSPQAERIVDLRTHRVPLTASLFAPWGLRARLRVTAVDQRGTFSDLIGNLEEGDDRFWVVDSSLGYQLPGRFGRITLEVRNLLDERFRYQETDPATPLLYPERLVLARLTVVF
jgi:tetratricopeptide (TPR) repeat protein